MRCFLAFILLFTTGPVWAANPLESGVVLGVEEGVYVGGGRLESQNWGVPDADYQTTRTLEGDVIIAKTVASINLLYMWEIEVARAQARLKVVPYGQRGEFKLLDLEDENKEAGVGQCLEDVCKFTVTVMGGELTLAETWVASPSGFVIRNGWQDFKGKEALYGQGKGDALTRKGEKN